MAAAAAGGGWRAPARASLSPRARLSAPVCAATLLRLCSRADGEALRRLRGDRRGLVSRFLALVPLAEAAASACRTLSVADAPPTGLPGQRPFRLHARPACRARQRGVGLAPGNRAQWRSISGLGAESSALPSAGLRRKASDARLVVCAGLEPWSRPGREAGMQWIRLVRAQRGSVGC